MAYNFFYYGPRLRRMQAEQRAKQELLAQEQARTATQAQPDTVGGAPATEVAEPDTLTSEPPEPVSAPSELPLASPGEGTVVTVETPLFQIQLSGNGARITSVRLQHYKTLHEPVELVRQEGNAGLLDTRLVGENRSLPLTEVRFDAYLKSSSQPLAGGTRVNVDTGAKTVVFRTVTGDGRQIERYYTFTPDSYVVHTGLRYANSQFPFARDIEWSFGAGMQATEVNVSDDQASMRATVRLGDEFHSKKPGDFSEEYSGTVQWAVLKTKYFISIMIPPAPVGGVARIAGVKDQHYLTAAIELPAVAERGGVDQALDVYLGPQDYKVLKSMGRGLEKNLNIGFEHVKIFKPVSQLVLWSMTHLYKVIPNYGLVIILISVLTKVLFYRLTHKSFKSMRDMQALQPKLAAVKEKYKDDKQKLSQETMKIYKESGVNPLGGCLPMLLQMPVFLALFNVLRNTIEIRRAPFFGWINDLSQQDVLFHLPMSLPIIGSAVSVLPLLMGVSMLVQSKIGGSIAGPESTSTQPKAFVYMMPIVFTFLFYKMPSGLVLYWLVNTVLSVAQQYYINKGAQEDEKRDAAKTDKKPPAGGDSKPAARPARKPRAKKG
jgi:YidC/Oxa1 family membrane protein insertase